MVPHFRQLGYLRFFFFVHFGLYGELVVGDDGQTPQLWITQYLDSASRFAPQNDIERVTTVESRWIPRVALAGSAERRG